MAHIAVAGAAAAVALSILSRTVLVHRCMPVRRARRIGRQLVGWNLRAGARVRTARALEAVSLAGLPSIQAFLSSTRPYRYNERQWSHLHDVICA